MKERERERELGGNLKSWFFETNFLADGGRGFFTYLIRSGIKFVEAGRVSEGGVLGRRQSEREREREGGSERKNVEKKLKHIPATCSTFKANIFFDN